MKPYRNNIPALFFFVTLVSGAIFFFRDSFAYHRYGNYSTLYSPDVMKWKDVLHDYPPQELEDARRILDSSINFADKPTSGKILEIGRLLYNRFHRQMGKPSRQLLAASPLTQYRILSSSGSARLWCGNFANMFAFFCWAEGIDCRVVEIMNPGDHHVLNECYLPESDKWVMTDVTYNQLLLLNMEKNSYVNLLYLRDSMPSRLLGSQATDTSIAVHPFQTRFYDQYFGHKNPINFYYHIDNSEVYSTPEKMKRYFFPVTWYEEVVEHPGGNALFYVKQFFILLWLVYFALSTAHFVAPGKLKLT